MGNPNDVPLTGDWDGDGDDTPGLMRPRSGQSNIWYLSNNADGSGVYSFVMGNPNDVPLTGDWDDG